MMCHGRIEVLPASFAERLPILVSQFLVQAAQEPLIVDTHGFEIAQLELLTVTTELRRQSVSLALKLLLGDVKRAEVLQRLLALNDLDVAVLVVSDQTVNLNLILGHHSHHLVAFSLAFAPVTLVFKRHINCIIVVRV